MPPFFIMQSKESQSLVTPQAALQMLKDGNKRFVEKNQVERDYHYEAGETSTSQYPFAAILGCIDSRVPVEVVFDQGFGDIFVTRIAGNIVNDDIIGSLEFSCKAVGAKLILILGHSNCGAILGTINDVKLGKLTGLLGKIKPAVDLLHSYEGDRSAANPDYVHKVCEMNVLLMIEKLRSESDILREMEEKGEILIKGAWYDIASGTVEFLD